MIYQIEWLIPNYLLSTTVSGPISADEVQQVANEIIVQMEAASGAALIHLLVDVRECSLGDKAWNYSKLQLRRHTSTGWVIVIGDSRLGGLVVAIFSKIINMRIQYSPLPASALDFLAQRDPIIADYLQQSGGNPTANEI